MRTTLGLRAAWSGPRWGGGGGSLRARSENGHRGNDVSQLHGLPPLSRPNAAPRIDGTPSPAVDESRPYTIPLLSARLTASATLCTCSFPYTPRMCERTVSMLMPSAFATAL